MSYPDQRDWTRAFEDAYEERRRQDAKWGTQNHDPSTWIVILAEEVGEAAREALAFPVRP